MLNAGAGALGDCTCAGCGHAEQVWTYNALLAMQTPDDSAVLMLYEAACGYSPADPRTDQGGIEQNVLTYWMKTGFNGRELTAFVEVDPSKPQDIRRTIADCGVCYIGFNVPQFLEDGLTAAGCVWDLTPSGDQSIIGGHCVILVGYDAAGNYVVISWGNFYTMTPAFFEAFVDEAYGLIDGDFVKANGTTPAGLSIADWQAQMVALNESVNG
jgi:hypothetical protein